MKTRMKVVDKAPKRRASSTMWSTATSATGRTRPWQALPSSSRLRPGKYVTAGNASQLSDGAAAVVLMEAKDAEKRGLEPLGRFVAWAAAGCEPDEMGIGPVFAVPKLLKRHGLKIGDIDLWNSTRLCQPVPVFP